MSADIVALGEPLVEFNQARADDPSTYLQGFGGDTSNMAIAAARVGARAGYVTRVGDDAFGRMFVALWQREGVATDGVAVDPDAPTGVYFVTHGARGHEFSYLRAGSAASRMAPATLPRDVIRRAFDIARIDFGRVDFSIVNGRVEIYEINTNPTLYNENVDTRQARYEGVPNRTERLLAAMAELQPAQSGAGPRATDDELQIQIGQP